VVPYSSVMATPNEPCQRAGGPFIPFNPAPITILFLDPQHVVLRSIDTARAGIDVPDSSRTLSIVSFYGALWGSGGEAPSTGLLTCRQFKRHSIVDEAAEDVTPSRSAGEAVRTGGVDMLGGSKCPASPSWLRQYHGQLGVVSPALSQATTDFYPRLPACPDSPVSKCN
jgi:hypothetical protein